MAAAGSERAGTVPQDGVRRGGAAHADGGVLAWSDAVAAAAIFAVDPHALGGIRLRGAAGALRDAWMAHLRELLGPAVPLRRVPASVDEARLLGGIDLAATLRSGRPVAEAGLLAQADGGVLLLPMAERLRPVAAALMASVLDDGALRVERDGFGRVTPVRLAVIACDEGIAPDEAPPALLLDRLALCLDLDGVHDRAAALAEVLAPPATAAQVQAARARRAGVAAAPALHEALCGACAALGIASLRVPLLALRVARAAAALDGATETGPEHAALAARLVIAPRARHGPVAPPDDGPGDAVDDAVDNAARAVPDDASAEALPEGSRSAAAPEAAPGPAAEAPDAPDAQDDGRGAANALAEVVLDAARAALPADLLGQLSGGAARRSTGTTAGRTGVQQRATRRGRPVGVRRGELRDGARLHVLETLRSAAPWQGLRNGTAALAGRRRLQVRREDFRIVRFRQRTQTTVIFVVDASGSAALHRLAEAKGAVELFLADCYVRRDQVALIAFRGCAAEVLLPPTRSLARARRCLAAVPGGGGTPIAAGLRAAAVLADGVRRRGDIPLLVLLTDGKANVALDGSGGRQQAGADALAMARVLRAGAIRALLVDCSPRPQADAQLLAQQLGGRYLALPQADAARVAGAVRTARSELV